MEQRNGSGSVLYSYPVPHRTWNINRGKSPFLYSGKYDRQLAIPLMVVNSLKQPLQVAVRRDAGSLKMMECVKHQMLYSF